MDKATSAAASLEEYVRDYKIFIDTCSLLHAAADKFWQNIIPMLEKHGKKIFIPSKVIDELKRHSENAESVELSKNAGKCLEYLKDLNKNQLISIKGEKTDSFADNLFLTVFTKFRMEYRLLLITQDKKLASDILALNNSQSVRSYPIHVKQINQYGYLSSCVNIKKEDFSKNDVNKYEIFATGSKVSEISAEPVKITSLPKENENVYRSDNSAIMLREEIGAGGEAVIYKTDTPYIAKIYRETKITKRKEAKIELMLKKKISCPGICYPIDILYNATHEFVGYLMPAAKGQALQKTVFAPKKVFLGKFPTWKKTDTVKLCITILEKIKYLHDRNILIGDINGMNILIESPDEVYFVDTDSFQIENFPCPVGTVLFSAPEIQGMHFTDFLRTKGNENFAVATLLFMIMLPGKPPYSQQGGEDMMSNIRDMDFSYPCGENSNKKTPLGPWRYIWSHLPYFIKESFYKTFRKGEAYSLEENRLTAGDWLQKFQYFSGLLESGKYGEQDPLSEELFPERLKQVKEERSDE